jgi:hypothetical protein
MVTEISFSVMRGSEEVRGESKSSRNLNLRANGYEYIEIPVGVSPHALLESAWKAVCESDDAE